ncbi:hypothetical protein PIB30_099825 [Stylosanthes scabra]|uniref:FZ domain-containing protein n=1 Tax=Stylosanthes scabra TaxID=79078 RepID=A0ABU6UWM0_9FABA|nr:hypothetical protein [Stylosanthes scabra]
MYNVEALSKNVELGNRRDKPIIEFDPEIEKTLKRNRSRAKAQRALQFEQEEANSEEGASEKSSEEEIVEENSEDEIQDNMADCRPRAHASVDCPQPDIIRCPFDRIWFPNCVSQCNIVDVVKKPPVRDICAQKENSHNSPWGFPDTTSVGKSRIQSSLWAG